MYLLGSIQNWGYISELSFGPRERMSKDIYSNKKWNQALDQTKMENKQPGRLQTGLDLNHDLSLSNWFNNELTWLKTTELTPLSSHRLLDNYWSWAVRWVFWFLLQYLMNIKPEHDVLYHTKYARRESTALLKTQMLFHLLSSNIIMQGKCNWRAISHKKKREKCFFRYEKQAWGQWTHYLILYMQQMRCWVGLGPTHFACLQLHSHEQASSIFLGFITSHLSLNTDETTSTIKWVKTTWLCSRKSHLLPPLTSPHDN